MIDRRIIKKYGKQILAGERPTIDIWYYIQGNLRYAAYYSAKYKKYIRPHIREQIDFRIQVMNIDCYMQGSCVKCGCETTMLQMANKPCEGLEYPPIVPAREWAAFLTGKSFISWGKYMWLLENGNTLRLYKEKEHSYVEINLQDHTEIVQQFV